MKIFYTFDLQISPQPKIMSIQNFIKGLCCHVFGHSYKLTHKISGAIKEYQCSTCKKEVATNLQGDLEVITSSKRKLHHMLQLFLEKKRNHKTPQLE